MMKIIAERLAPVLQRFGRREEVIEPPLERSWWELKTDQLNDPVVFFNSTLMLVLSTALIVRFLEREAKRALQSNINGAKEDVKPASVKSLQQRYLPVFWLMRTAFWMSGPYFYAAYSSKTVDGRPLSLALISQIFLSGFACIGLVGPLFGRIMDQFGRKKGSIAAAAVYAIGALSLRSSKLSVLFVGRAFGGIGTSLMGSAPEAWLISEFQKSCDDLNGKWLRDTFGWAYSMDSIVAIIAGQIATNIAEVRGPVGPFEVSPILLALAAGIAIVFWQENVAQGRNSNKIQNGYDGAKNHVPTIRDACNIVMKDEKLLMLGAVQSLFESSMHIFVMMWPRAMDAAVKNMYGSDAVTPYGTIFSCFMACCMLGSSVFGRLSKRSTVTTLAAVSTETTTVALVAVACLALTGAATVLSGTVNLSRMGTLASLVATFFLYEGCVGIYFPSIGTLRSRFVPGSHRSLIMALFAVPLNILTVTVFLFIDKIGTLGAISIASLELSLATICMLRLRSLWRVQIQAIARRRWKGLKTTLLFFVKMNQFQSIPDNPYLTISSQEPFKVDLGF